MNVLQASEFKKFLLRGNVVELAVGVLMGIAFKSVVDSLVADIFTPLVAAIIGEPDFSALSVSVNGSAITYGNFLNVLLSFAITAAVVFYFIVLPVNRVMSRFRAAPGTPEPTTRKCPFCWTEIPNQATRCASCTSEVEPVTAAAV